MASQLYLGREGRPLDDALVAVAMAAVVAVAGLLAAVASVVSLLAAGLLAAAIASEICC